MMIPAQPMIGAQPVMCSENVRKRIKACGGKAVYGWERDKRGPYTDCLLSHVVWEDKDGKLWDVTPKIKSIDANYLAECEFEPTEFIRDDAAAFDTKSLPSRYVPKDGWKDDKHVQKACEYMSRSDEFLRVGEVDKCRYWTGKANTEMRRGRVDAGWQTPESTDIRDVLPTMGIEEPLTI